MTETDDTATDAPPLVESMGLIFVAVCWPMRFFTTRLAPLATPRYYVAHTTDEEDIVEVSRDTWLDLLAAGRTGALAQIADALDDSFSVRLGETASIADSLAHIAAHQCGDTGVEVFSAPKPDQEPS